MNRLTLLLGAALLVAGCFTVSETAAPTITIHANCAAATNTTVAVRGFATTLTKYQAVDGYQTVFYDGGWPHGYCYHPGIATAHTTTYLPQERPCDAFLEQARNRMETIGFNVMAQTPDYVVEGRFSGPCVTAGDAAASIAWFVCSLLTCDHSAQTWTARLKIHDNRTGRLLFTREYSQRYEVTGFSPIPLLGISSYERTAPSYMQCWCLGALTERMTADAAAFLTTGK